LKSEQIFTYEHFQKKWTFLKIEHL
jgi:hypothetical protein